MSEPEELSNVPLFVPDDILNQPKTPEAVERDIAEDLDYLRQGNAPETAMHRKLLLSHQILHNMSFAILDSLVACGVEDMQTLRERLFNIDPAQQPLDTDLFAVARSYEAERVASTDLEEQNDLKRYALIADALASIAVAKAVQLRGTTVSQLRMLIAAADEKVEAAAPEVPAKTYYYLHLIVKKLQQDLPSSAD